MYDAARGLEHMAVEIEENLRHYRMTVKLGVGGMGEVCRVEDTSMSCATNSAGRT
jgi:hypothetical protein